VGRVDQKIELLEYTLSMCKTSLEYLSPVTAPLSYAGQQAVIGDLYQALAVYQAPRQNLHLAVAAYLETLKYHSINSAPLSYASILRALGKVYNLLASRESDARVYFELALSSLKEALLIYDPALQPHNYASTCHRISKVYCNMADSGIAKLEHWVDEARCYIENALAYLIPQNDPSLYIEALSESAIVKIKLAVLQDRTQDLEHTLDEFYELAAISIIELKTNARRIHWELGDAYWLFFEKSQRLSYLSKSIEWYEEALTRFPDSTYPLASADISRALGRNYEAFARFEEAISNRRRAISYWQFAANFYGSLELSEDVRELRAKISASSV